MKHKLSFFAILLMALALPQSVRAYDFSAVAPSGQTLYYDIVDGEAWVTSQYTASLPTYLNLTGDLTIPSSVTYGGTTYSVTSINNYAFQGCSDLTSATIPNSVTSIGYRAFEDCSGLTSITVDSDNPVYDSRNNCNAIIVTATNILLFGCKNTIIPTSVTSIENYAFSGCSGLTSLTIPNSVTRIENYAFSGCSGLTSLTIPSSVTSIENYAFSGCSGLDSITVANGNPTYDSRNNCNAIIKTATNTLIAGCKNTIIPTSVTSIGEGAFFGYSGLTSVTIPNSVTEIHYSAFEDCSGLTSLTIGNSVTDIGPWAFYNCTNLAEVTCLATTPPSLGGDVFYGIASPCTLTVPCGTEQAYQASGWGTDFSTIQCDEVGIGDVDAAGIAVYAADGRIVVRGAAGLEVRVFDAVGHEVVLSADRGETPLLPTGVYLVKVGTLPAKKVVVTR